MPIFMDRHDLPESVTAEEVARLHQEDLKIEHKYGCKGMTYWFDEVRNTAFCLIQAPNKKALQDMHNEAHGAVANRIIEVEPSIVESFLGRIEDPVKAQNTDLNIINDPAFRILMVMRLNQCVSERASNNEMKALNEALRKIVENYDGTEVQSIRSKQLISFFSVTDALKCALELVDFFEKVEADSSPSLKLKIGLSSGLPFEHEEGLFKQTIQRADRLCDAVEGSIIMTSELKELYESENLNSDFPGNKMRTLNPEEERFLGVLMDFLESSYSRADLKVEHFSSSLGVSKAQLYRKLKGLTGKSLNGFLKDYRLEQAMNLLLKRKGNISEVAFDTGFNSPAYFSKCFSQSFGVLPSEMIR